MSSANHFEPSARILTAGLFGFLLLLALDIVATILIFGQSPFDAFYAASRTIVTVGPDQAVDRGPGWANTREELPASRDHRPSPEPLPSPATFPVPGMSAGRGDQPRNREHLGCGGCAGHARHPPHNLAGRTWRTGQRDAFTVPYRCGARRIPDRGTLLAAALVRTNGRFPPRAYGLLDHARRQR